ncbi:MAG: S8 family serine peptidase [Oscillatoria sp. PMC 1068.18]|nr:S8 family serine peptidase [Oscillatoria sp. PMC 1076.18]MEC4987395.1 S8 family serine peptidase [Oscillatoria sp. PMC 1068.18]
MRKKLALLVSGLAALSAPALALDTSVGQGGIDARRLHEAPYNLTGRKIAIGQVEIGRPGLFGLDKVVSWNPALSLAGVFHRDSPAESNKFVDTHAGMVAAVMVSGDKDLRGVAPDARLYASAVGSLRRGGQAEECLSSQHVALQNNDDVRAINYSFGESLRRDPRPDASLDGNALLTRCVDWSARVHDVLYVIAGNQGSGGIPIPTDLFNGITTAYSTERDGVFTKVDFANLSDLPEGIGRSLIQQEINLGPRRAINLVAPGSNITVFDLDGKVIKVSGTSFAAPHITASVALLQEFGDTRLARRRSHRQLKQETSNWSLNSRRHEVMKAVLLNSADKVQDSGDGSLLGMSRTMRTKNNRTWFEGDAAQDDKIPLDIQMGTGHLNVFRAYQQFSGGQWSPESSAPALGWDYRTVAVNSSQDYQLEQPLQKGSYAAVTLAWDRLVELNDKNRNDRYDLGENFRDRGLNNLDVYLMPIDSNDSSRSICTSVSEADSVEHIFCQVPETGRYKIRVQYQSQVNEETQAYGLAWWTKPAQ